MPSLVLFQWMSLLQLPYLQAKNYSKLLLVLFPVLILTLVLTRSLYLTPVWLMANLLKTFDCHFQINIYFQYL